MTKQFRYIFYRSSKKWTCPGCNKKRFVRYLDNATGQLLPGEYGRCDRSDNCGYWLDPYKNGYAKEVWQRENNMQQTTGIKPTPMVTQTTKPKKEPVYIPTEVLQETLTAYHENTFINNLIRQHHFKAGNIKKVISMYALGTIAKGFRKGAITFPFIDNAGNIHAIQVKEFDANNHTTGQGFYHTMIEYRYKQAGKDLPAWLTGYNENDKRVNCFFGAHLINKYSTNTIALVEAPKTAIYGTLFFGLPKNPGNMLWLAVYNKSSLTAERFKVLKGRNVVFFPDNNAYNLWSQKANEFKNIYPGTNISVSGLMELSSGNDGGDLADYLDKFDPMEFAQPEPTEPSLSELIEKQFTERMNIKHWIINPDNYPKLTWYNIDILIEDIEKHHHIKVTPVEYLEAFNKLLPPK